MVCSNLKNKLVTVKGLMIVYDTILNHGPFFKKLRAILFIALLFVSCKALVPTPEEKVVFKTLDEVKYPFQEITNDYVSKSFSDVLEEKEVMLLENWRGAKSILANFLQAECAGCPNQTAGLKPLYKIEKGRFLHFGLQNEMGVENWVFKKNGKFVTRFYMFQGESQKTINEELKNIQNINYVLEGIYPSAIHTKKVYLEHVAYTPLIEAGNEWYEAIYPTIFDYSIDLTEKNPVLRFKFKGGLYSYQKNHSNGEYQLVNFVEPLFYANAVTIDKSQSLSSFTDAFYANATFFLMELEEEAEVSIRIETKVEGTDFSFSIFENNGFFTVEEYLNKKRELFGQYKALLDKGSYLLRVLHENADYGENPLYTVKIDKANVH